MRRGLCICQAVYVSLRFMAGKSPTLSLDLLVRRAGRSPTRLRLLNLIADREICVCYLVEILRISQPKVSRVISRTCGALGWWLRGAKANGCITGCGCPRTRVRPRCCAKCCGGWRSIQAMRRDVSRLGVGVLRAAKLAGAVGGAATARPGGAAAVSAMLLRMTPSAG